MKELLYPIRPHPDAKVEVVCEGMGRRCHYVGWVFVYVKNARPADGASYYASQRFWLWEAYFPWRVRRWCQALDFSPAVLTGGTLFPAQSE